MRTRRPGPNLPILVVRTESAFALEMQHLAPIVIERVNTYYGWRCIGRIVLKQGPVHAAEKKRPVVPRLERGGPAAGRGRDAADRGGCPAACPRPAGSGDRRTVPRTKA